MLTMMGQIVGNLWDISVCKINGSFIKIVWIRRFDYQAGEWS
jgi:hypothetical protein